jgi:hypothetical protein
MTSDAARPPDKRYGYPNVFSGFVSLVRAEGFRGLMRGVGVNTVSLHPGGLKWAYIIVSYSQGRAILMTVRFFTLSQSAMTLSESTTMAGLPSRIVGVPLRRSTNSFDKSST